jgi:pilus retraction protein PilT
VQAFKHAGGLGLTCRLLKSHIADLNTLHIPPDITALLKKLVSKKQGLGIVSGPTGSGKSTTLAALVEWARVNTHRHIVTIEDPIEYFYPDNMLKEGIKMPSPSLVTQQEVGDHVRSYAHGLKDALRKKPDIILVGEVRDAETMQTVFDAAQTGHLILTTMHTRGAAKTLLRILEFFPREDGEAILSRLADILLFVMSQGLLPSRLDDSNRLCLEFLANTTPETQSCIRGYKLQANQLEDTLARSPNVQWTNFLKSMRKEGLISEETCNEYASLGC